jgi:hypothetical protein
MTVDHPVDRPAERPSRLVGHAVVDPHLKTVGTVTDVLSVRMSARVC